MRKLSLDIKPRTDLTIQLRVLLSKQPCLPGAAGEPGGPPPGGGRLLGGCLHGPGQDHPGCCRGQGAAPRQGDGEAHH